MLVSTRPCETPAIPTLDRIRVPTLYLRATEDRFVPRSAAAPFARLASGARVVEIEGPHFLLQANPVEAARS
jgi:pimeloyl-ACP methyl ester carboxylesterase